MKSTNTFLTRMVHKAKKATGDLLPPSGALPTGYLFPGFVFIFFLDSVLQQVFSSKSTGFSASYCFELSTQLMLICMPVILYRLYRWTGKSSVTGKDSWLESFGMSSKAQIGTAQKLSKGNGSTSGRTHQESVAQQQQEKERNIAFQLQRCNQAINDAAKADDADLAEQLLGDIPKLGLKPDSVSFNSVIHACARQGDIPRAEHWMRKMRASGVEPNVISFNIIIDTCVKADDAEAAEKWMGRMLDSGLQPNEVSFATVIHARAKRGDTKKAEQWFRKMLEVGVEPNVVGYNSLIYACSRAGDLMGAERWVVEMEERGVAPRVTTYTAVVDACAKAGDSSRAEKWMEKMFASGMEPTVVSYSAMIDACAKVGDCVNAEKWHSRMLELGVKPNAHTFSAVINACAKAGELFAACQWLARMEKSDVPPDVVVYSAVLDACAKVMDTDRARQVFQQMRSQGIRPNVVAYASLARPFAHRGNWFEVERLEAEMLNEGLVINEYFLYTLLLSYASARPRESNRAEAAFCRAISMNVKPNKHVMTALARAIGRTRCNQLVQELDLKVDEVPVRSRHAPS